MLWKGFLRALWMRRQGLRLQRGSGWDMPTLVRDDGRTPCVACHLCAAACPVGCIDVEAGPDPRGERERYPAEFSIDMSRCVYCGLCARACPEDALHMERRQEPLAVASRLDLQRGL